MGIPPHPLHRFLADDDDDDDDEDYGGDDDDDDDDDEGYQLISLEVLDLQKQLFRCILFNILI